MNREQLTALLHALDYAARLCNGEGTLAQNEHADTVTEAAWAQVATHQLGDGLLLQMMPPASPESLAAASGVNGTEAIGGLANGMAHSIRNPLSSIVTAAGLIKDDPALCEETALLLGIIVKESKHLNQILTDFLNYVRPQKTNPTRFDIGTALRALAAALVRDAALSAEVRLRDEIDSDLWVRGDEAQLRQALWNVLVNAGEAMLHGGLLTLTGKILADKVRLTIADRGRGCSTTELAHAFDPFYTGSPESTGLGLTLARAAISAALGSIELLPNAAAGDDGGGMRVVIELPRA